MAPAGAVDTAAFASQARKDLLHFLQSVPGRKNFVIQRALVGPVELLVKFSTLQEYGVERVFILENNNVDSSQKNILFLARADQPKPAQAVAAQIKRLQEKSHVTHEFFVAWTPRRTLLGDKILEESGVLGDVTSSEFELYFQPLDHDLLSLELSESFEDLFLRKDPTCLYTSAKALMAIQKRHGLFPQVLGKGQNAERVTQLLLRMRSELSADEGHHANGIPTTAGIPSSTLENLIIVDRGTDLASPLLTQLTYEGLIDESFQIDHTQAEIDASIVGMAPTQPSQNSTEGTSPQGPLKRKIRLDGSDKLYASLRDANFAIVGQLLNRVARRLQEDYEHRHSNKTTAELREFVNKLPGYQAEQQGLKTHTGLAEDLLKRTRSDNFRGSLEVQQNLSWGGADQGTMHDTIEDLIGRDAPIETVLRLLCLESSLNGGLRLKDFNYFRQAIVQAYGHQHILTLDALEKMQLFTIRSGASPFAAFSSATAGATGVTRSALTMTNYSAVRKPLCLAVDDVDEENPADVAYVYSGIAPLSIRLVQCVLQKPYLTSLSRAGGSTSGAAAATSSASTTSAAEGWRGFDDSLRNIAGPTIDESQTNKDKSVRAKQVLEGRGGRKTSVIFFVGGITFAEVAALRFVAEKERERRDLLICTTQILSGDRMMKVAIGESSVLPN
ncbi:MAG: hypothetical protein M1831_000815 [Alyxoria varia]|nr:MAG: hypothetical protein M1831_000815 [Alyxoria varia]